MSVQHFKSLLFKATQIQREIEKEQSRRLPDWMRLLKLKKLRLKIKDKLHRFSEHTGQSTAYGAMRPVLVHNNAKTKQR